jgi:predicted ATPase
MIQLQSVEFLSPAVGDQARFPFTIPAIASLQGAHLRFPTEVTFLVGENGSGKSTILEALAAAAGAITVGSAQAAHDHSLQHIRPLARHIRLAWTRKIHRGFFMRSEDFFGYTQRLRRMEDELQAERDAVEADPTLSPVAKGLASLPYNNELHALRRRYGAGLDAVSHGESFLTVSRARFVPNGLYLLDEPEAPLSPMRQLALIALIKQCVQEQDAQFIIATHSPILMATPCATIYTFDDGRVRPIAYDEIEHVRLTRDFLNAPERFLRHL